MKVRVLSKFYFNNKIYRAGEVIASPPVSKEKMDNLVELAKKIPHLLEILPEEIKKKEKIKNVS